MSKQSQETSDQGWIRETYEEFQVGETTVAMIADPHAQDAWIQSDIIHQVAP